ncbi:MAG: DUF58 domain-containing protein [Pseudonocardiaceae bacterium]
MPLPLTLPLSLPLTLPLSLPLSLPLTAAGWSVLTGCAVLYGTGALLGYPVLVGLAVGGAVLLTAAGVFVSVRPAVSLGRTIAPDRLRVGEPALGRVVIRNLSRWPAPGFVVVDRIAGDELELAVPGLAAGGWRTVQYPVPTSRRGRLPLGPVTVERRDPLGLFRRAQPLGGEDVLWVHPRVHPMRALPVGTVPDFEGRRTDNARTGTVTFSSLREYVVGDDPRRIHWRTTARTGSLMVREHVDTTEPTTTIVLDTRAAVLRPAAFEHAVEAAASVTQAAEDGGRPACLHVVGADAAADAEAGAVSIADRLAAAVQLPDSEPVRLLDVVERAEPGGALVVVTGGAEPALVARLAAQRRRFSPVVVLVVLDDAQQAPPLRRRPGMAVLAAGDGAGAATTWNRMVAGEPG